MKDDLTDAERLQERLEAVRKKSEGYVGPRGSIPENERPPQLPPNPETEEYRRRYGNDA